MNLLPFTQFVRDIFTATAHKQDQKGLVKYNQPLDPYDSKHDWNVMIEEELVDAYKYLIAERTKRDKVIEELNEELLIVEKNVSFLAREDIEERVQAIRQKLHTLSKTFNKME